MIIHMWIQWKEVWRNKRHFLGALSAAALWDLNAVKSGVHAEVRPGFSHPAS